MKNTQDILQTQLFIEDLYIKDQNAWSSKNSLEEVYEVINTGIKNLQKKVIDKIGFVHPDQYGKKTAQYFYTLMVHADFFKDLQKEYLSWLKDNALVQILDKYNLEKRINELNEPLNLDKKEFANLQKKLFGNPVQAIVYFEELEYIRPFYTTKTLGNLSFRYGEFDEVVKNRRKMLQILNESNAVQNKITTHDFVFASLRSQDKIAIWPQVWEKAGMSLKDYDFETITTQELEKIGLAVDAIILSDLESVKAGGFVVGDCYVLMIIAPKQNVGALVHIGTPGLSLDLLGKVVNKLQKDFNVLPQDLYVMMGPGILKDYYIYEDISRYKDNPFVKDFLIPVKTGHGYHVDLFGGIRHRLLELGIPFEKYRITSQDTYVSKFLFSHVRSLKKGEPEGRFMVGFVNEV